MFVTLVSAVSTLQSLEVTLTVTLEEKMVLDSQCGYNHTNNTEEDVLARVTLAVVAGA